MFAVMIGAIVSAVLLLALGAGIVAQVIGAWPAVVAALDGDPSRSRSTGVPRLAPAGG